MHIGNGTRCGNRDSMDVEQSQKCENSFEHGAKIQNKHNGIQMRAIFGMRFDPSVFPPYFAKIKYICGNDIIIPDCHNLDGILSMDVEQSRKCRRGRGVEQVL